MNLWSDIMIMLNLFTGHKLLTTIILLLFLINVGCIIYLVIKERKKDKEEIGDILDSLSKAKPREEKESTNSKLDDEEVEAVEEVKKPKLEIDKVLEAMQKNLEMTPEDAVASFEKEQEEKSIISYQELVDSFKKADSTVSDTVEMFKADFNENLEEIEFESEEVKQEKTIEEKEKQEKKWMKEKEQDVKQNKEDRTILAFDLEKDLPEIDIEKEENKDTDIDVIDIEEETLKLPKVSPTMPKQEKVSTFEKKKFQNTDFISPIYGKLDEKEMDYPTVPPFSKTEALEELLEENKLKKRRPKEGFGETLDMDPLHSEMEKNDEFLKTLKDFRGNL